MFRFIDIIEYLKKYFIICLYNRYFTITTVKANELQ